MKHLESIKMNNFGLSVSTFVKHNPFGNVKNVSHSHLGRCYIRNALVVVQAHIVKM
jgi:hypothetical protein